MLGLWKKSHLHHSRLTYEVDFSFWNLWQTSNNFKWRNDLGCMSIYLEEFEKHIKSYKRREYIAWKLLLQTSFNFFFKETEEVFKVKKSSYSKKIVKLLKKEYKEDLEKSKIKTDVNSSADSKYQINMILLKCVNESAHRDWMDLLWSIHCEFFQVTVIVKGPNSVVIQFYLILTQ